MLLRLNTADFVTPETQDKTCGILSFKKPKEKCHSALKKAGKMCNFSREDEVLNYLQRAKKEVINVFIKNSYFLYKKTRVNQSIVKNFQ